LNNGISCGYNIGNSCKFTETCSKVLATASQYELNVKFLDINGDSLILPLPTLMRETTSAHEPCILLIHNLGTHS
jgi:hypothetical protein